MYLTISNVRIVPPIYFYKILFQSPSKSNKNQADNISGCLNQFIRTFIYESSNHLYKKNVLPFITRKEINRQVLIKL